MRNTQQQRPCCLESHSLKPGPSVQIVSPMGRESCYEWSPKRSWQCLGVLNLPFSSLPLEGRDAKEGGPRYSDIGHASTPATGIEVISFLLSSSEGLKNVMSSRRLVSGLLVRSPLNAQQMLFRNQPSQSKTYKRINW